MTDHFEQAKDAILKEARANGGVTTDHLLDALIATNEDLDEKTVELARKVDSTHAETVMWHKSVSHMVAEHIKEAEVRDRRITNLEIDMEDRRKSCRPLVEQLIHDEHEQRHGAYVATLADENFRDRLVWFFASNVGKVALLVIGLVAGLLLNLIVYGKP